MLTYYYNSNAQEGQSQVVDKNWVSIYGGINPDSSTPEELAAQGFYSFVRISTPQYNPKIYTINEEIVIEGTDANQTLTVEALPLNDSKSFYTGEINRKAYSLLLPTDWVIVRQSETGISAPSDILSWREAVRVEAQLKRETIEDCKTAKRLDSYVSSEDYTSWPQLLTFT